MSDYIPKTPRTARRKRIVQGPIQGPIQDPPLDPVLVAPDAFSDDARFDGSDESPVVDVDALLPALPQMPAPRHQRASAGEVNHALAAAQSEINALRAELADVKGRFAFYVQGAQQMAVPWVLVLYLPVADQFTIWWEPEVENPRAFLESAVMQLNEQPAEQLWETEDA